VLAIAIYGPERWKIVNATISYMENRKEGNQKE
jgi:hypothetical protein